MAAALKWKRLQKQSTGGGSGGGSMAAALKWKRLQETTNQRWQQWW